MPDWSDVLYVTTIVLVAVGVFLIYVPAGFLWLGAAAGFTAWLLERGGRNGDSATPVR